MDDLKKKQIEEMASFFMSLETYDHEECENCGKWEHNCCDDGCFANKVAIDFYNTGYCKQSLIVEEILKFFRESLNFDKQFHNYNIGTGYNWAMSEVRKVLFEIEQKYIPNQNKM